jgi:DNA-binding FadR family transcriptional regulator
MSTKIDNPGLVDRVVQRIGQEIVTGRLKAGEMLPNEADLCEQLGVSRSVLREAVRVLASKGLLETKARLGTRVRAAQAWSRLDPAVLIWQSAIDPPDRFVRELFGLRRVVEPMVADLAARCISEPALALLEASFRDMVDAGDDPERYFGPDFQFHQLILAAADNSLIEALGQTIKQALEITLRLSLPAPRGQQRATPLHRAVLDAIRNRLPDAAREAMIRLINDAEEDVWQALAAKRENPPRSRRQPVRSRHKTP